MWWHRFECREKVGLTYWLWMYVNLYWHETFNRELGEFSVPFPNGIAVSYSSFPHSSQKSLSSSFILSSSSLSIFFFPGLFLMLVCAVLQLCDTSFYSCSTVVMLMMPSSKKKSHKQASFFTTTVSHFSTNAWDLAAIA